MNKQRLNFFDQIALNRLIKIISNFILGLLKLITPKENKPIDIPKPKRPKIFPWRNKDE
jgi:hypothetical protein